MVQFTTLNLPGRMMSDASLSRTFARNLDHLLRLQDLSRIAAAETAQVPYKWLRRAVTQGISASSVKNTHHIEKLVAFFELSSMEDLWREDLIQLQVSEDSLLAASPFENARRQLCVKKVKSLLSSEHAEDAYRLVGRLFDKSELSLSDSPQTVAPIPSTWKSIIKWSGSKKRQAAQIVTHFPRKIVTYHEPFLGGGSVLLELLTSDIEVGRFQCSDNYSPLINLWNLVKYEPQRVATEYKRLRAKLSSTGSEFYYQVRTSFNQNHDPCELFFLLQTTKNGFFRFNRKGEFMGGFRKGDFGTQGATPGNVTVILATWSEKLVTRNVTFEVRDYLTVSPKLGDVLYLDPPYPNANRPIYPSQIDFDQFFAWLGRQKSTYLLSLDGFRDTEDRLTAVPPHLFDEHLQIENPNPFNAVNGKSGRSVTESLYLHKANAPKRA